MLACHVLLLLFSINLIGANKNTHASEQAYELNFRPLSPVILGVYAVQIPCKLPSI